MRSVGCCLLLCGLATSAAAAARVEVILDTSQEMWAALDDGRPRFVAARVALTDWLLERSADSKLELGLRLTGGGPPDGEHESCEEPSLAVPPGAPDAAAWRAALEAVRPAGARPLLSAVTAAAADLGQGEQPRRIVLVTSGEESCFGDEQAAVAALAGGVELRVVGMGLPAEAVTRFSAVAPSRDARSTAALLAALRWAVEGLAAASAGDAQVQVCVPDGPRYQTAALVGAVTAERRELTASGDCFTGAAPPGLYALELAGEEVAPAQLDEVAVSAAAGLELALELPPPALADLEVIPDRPLAGGPIFVGLGGVGAGPCRVTVTPADGPVPAWVDAHSAVGPADLVELRAPDEPGPLTVRLHEALAGGSSRVIAGAQVDSLPPEVTLAAPEEVRPFDPFQASWTGPDNPGDQLVVAREGAPSAAHAACSPTTLGSPAALVAPGEEGQWELRYVSGLSGQTLAHAAIEVNAVIVTLAAPTEVAAGTAFKVGWEGPAGPADYLALASEASADGDYISLHLASQGSPARFVAPWEPGSYEIRYIEGGGGRVRRRAAVSVVATPVTLKAPRRVRAGTRFELRWTGPNRPGDYLAVAASGAAPQEHEDWCFTSAGSPASLAAPFAAGSFELRYISGGDQAILAALPIVVE